MVPYWKANRSVVHCFQSNSQYRWVFLMHRKYVDMLIYNKEVFHIEV